MSVSNEEFAKDKVELKVLGISYSQLQSGAYAMLLAETDGPYRIPVVIGSAEAQAIAIKIEGVTPPRPMTHDLFASFAASFAIELQRVFIYKFEDGIFSAEMTFSYGQREVTVDSRTSDAVAIALRMNAPIYTTREIINQAGTIMDENGNQDESASTAHADEAATPRHDADEYESMSLDDLHKRLTRMIEDENYEEAARINEIIRRREQE